MALYTGLFLGFTSYGLYHVCFKKTICPPDIRPSTYPNITEKLDILLSNQNAINNELTSFKKENRLIKLYIASYSILKSSF